MTHLQAHLAVCPNSARLFPAINSLPLSSAIVPSLEMTSGSTPKVNLGITHTAVVISTALGWFQGVPVSPNVVRATKEQTVIYTVCLAGLVFIKLCQHQQY